jgi:ATPase subunit of ABC transporter with duplicated ATPase domains
MQSIVCDSVEIMVSNRRLVRNFTWSRGPGGVSWFVGSNGSGKSSLLRVLAGWQRPSSGNIKWEGVKNQTVSFFNPEMHAPPDLIIADYIRFIKRRTGGAGAEALFPGTVDSHVRFSTLSTGEAKRLLLWGLLNVGHAPLVLDEPYEHLSRDAKVALTAGLRERALTSVVLIATNQDVPFEAGDSVLTFENDFIEVGHGL